MRPFITFLSIVFLFPLTQGKATQSFNFEEEMRAFTNPQLQNPDRRYVKISITGQQKEEFLEALATTCTQKKIGVNGSHSFHKKMYEIEEVQNISLIHVKWFIDQGVNIFNRSTPKEFLPVFWSVFEVQGGGVSSESCFFAVKYKELQVLSQ